MIVHNIYTVTLVEREWNMLGGTPAPQGLCIEAKMTGFYDTDPIIGFGSTVVAALENLAKTIKAYEKLKITPHEGE